MRIAVCESDPEMMPGDGSWQTLTEQAQTAKADLFLLNEMAFGSWISASPRPDSAVLSESRLVHDYGIAMFGSLAAPTVMSSRPVDENGTSVNQGFIWHEGEVTPVHNKQFFPQEPGYYEASWFRRGKSHFRIGEALDLQVGFQICTEIMFNEWSRYYGHHGAHIIVVPRAVGAESLSRWKTALSMAAIVSGCYVLSSNRSGADSNGQVFGGHGWIFDPLGDCIAETSQESPVVYVEFDKTLVERAQSEYPCYVEELG